MDEWDNVKLCCYVNVMQFLYGLAVFWLLSHPWKYYHVLFGYRLDLCIMLDLIIEWSENVHSCSRVVMYLSDGYVCFCVRFCCLQWVLSSKEINFPYPLALTLLHMVFSSVVCFVLTKVLKVNFSVWYNLLLDQLLLWNAD